MKLTGSIVALILSVATLGAALYAGSEAQAKSSFFTGRGCSSCHSAPATSTCNGCHFHGAVSLRGTTNKTSYAPGETVSVTISGGEESGWVGVNLYDQNNVKIANSTGNASGMGHSATLPAVLTAPAPAAPGTYTWKAAWHGNTANSGSTHGNVTVNTNSFTVTVPADTTPPTLSISNPANGTETRGAQLEIVGSTSDLSGIKALTINGVAVSIASDGSFRHSLSLALGSNAITTISTDNYNNTTTDTRGVTLVKKSSQVDFDGDGQDDLAIWRPGTGEWCIINSASGASSSVPFGSNGDKQVPGDYDGDGKTDLAVWRSKSGAWVIMNSSTGYVTTTYFGGGSDIPVPADYDGDGKTDIAIWRPSTGAWVINSTATSSQSTTFFGGEADLPIPADFNADGKADIAIWRPSNGAWVIKSSTTGAVTTTFFGNSADITVPADYDGDGKADIGIWRPSTGAWVIKSSSSGAVSTTYFGSSTDIPVPADYDKVGKAEIAVWRPSIGKWCIMNPLNASVRTELWGMQTDKPLSLIQAIK